jgi:aminopeptidase S
LRFGFFTGEELGLFGSRAYVDGLSAAERRDVKAYVNLDMIGSPNPVVEVYDTDNAVEAALRDALGDVKEERVGAVSDHDAFDRAGIDVSGVYTGGEEEGPGGEDRDPCYHRACDTARSADPALTARLARRVERALAALSG